MHRSDEIIERGSSSTKPQMPHSRSKVALNAVVCDLIRPKSEIQRQIDVFIFNPPYVPTKEEEVLLAQVRGRIAGHHKNGPRLGAYYKALPATGEIG
jgi:hypothetical protein